MRKKRESLSSKIMIYLIVVIFLLTIVQTFISLYFRYSSGVEDYERSFKIIKQEYLKNISVALATTNKKELYRELRHLKDLQGLPNLILYDESKLKIITSFRQKECFTQARSKVFNLTHNEKNVGHLDVSLCMDTLYEEIKDAIMSTLLYELITLIVLSSVILLILNRIVVKPIMRVIHYMRQLNDTNLNRPLIYNEADFEINDLIQSINKVRLHLLSTITVLQNKEEIIKSMNEKLEADVSSRTQMLQISNLELANTIHQLKQTQNILVQQEKMASLGSLVAGISHEINTPVGLAVTGVSYLQELQKELKSSYENDQMSEEDFNEYLRKNEELIQSVLISLQKAAQLVRGFKQISVDQSSEIKREFNLCKYLDEIVLSLHSQLKQRQIKIIIECSVDLKINSYPGVISQIMTNLIQNSLTHAFKKDEKGVIKIEVTTGYEHLFITYSDNGAGINEESLKKIYDPFYTTNREAGGTGLGLNIVYNLITTKLQGQIACESTPKLGVKFKMNFKLGV